MIWRFTESLTEAFDELLSPCHTLPLFVNKKAMSQIKEKIQNGTIDLEVSLLSVLPDCPHVGKCLKGSFANWFLQQENEHENLALIATLRKRSDPRTKITLKGYLPKNDDLKNKDRHDPSAVLRLTKKNC